MYDIYVKTAQYLIHVIHTTLFFKNASSVPSIFSYFFHF